jgi:hypothetical protein
VIDLSRPAEAVQDCFLTLHCRSASLFRSVPIVWVNITQYTAFLAHLDESMAGSPFFQLRGQETIQNRVERIRAHITGIATKILEVTLGNPSVRQQLCAFYG